MELRLYSDSLKNVYGNEGKFISYSDFREDVQMIISAVLNSGGKVIYYNPQGYFSTIVV